MAAVDHGYIVSFSLFLGYSYLIFVWDRAGFTTVMSIIFLKETYLPYLIARSEGKRSAPASISFRHSITRPLRMLFFAPAVTAMSLYVAIIYGITYLHLVTIPLLFGPSSEYGLFTYRWLHGNTGLAYLGAGTFDMQPFRPLGARILNDIHAFSSTGSGCLLSIITCVFGLNRSYRYMCDRYGAQKPEFRMPAMQVNANRFFSHPTPLTARARLIVRYVDCSRRPANLWLDCGSRIALHASTLRCRRVCIWHVDDLRTLLLI